VNDITQISSVPAGPASCNSFKAHVTRFTLAVFFFWMSKSHGSDPLACARNLAASPYLATRLPSLPEVVTLKPARKQRRGVSGPGCDYLSPLSAPRPVSALPSPAVARIASVMEARARARAPA